MDNSGFLDLSDEIIVYIFSHLDGIDKINLSLTCRRFSNILCEKSLSRKLKFLGNYSLTLNDIRCYLKPKMMQHNLRVLDLTNCYWLMPSGVCTLVLKLKGLTAFYAVDIAFNINQIAKIVIELPELKYLSLTWPRHSKIDDEVRKALECLSSLAFLYVYVVMHDFNLPHFCTWIRSCKNLKELWMISTPRGGFPWSCCRALNELVYNIPPMLHTFVVVGDLDMAKLGLEPKMTPELCKCLWFPSSSSIWRKFLNNEDPAAEEYLDTSCAKNLENLAYYDQRISLGKQGKWKRFFWTSRKPLLNAGDDRFEELEALGAKSPFSFRLLQYLPRLTVLCIPACCFSAAAVQWIMLEEAWNVPKWCPQIQHLEMQWCENCRNNRAQNEFLFELIAYWPQLKVLKLSDYWCLRSGKVFDKIFRSCTKLERLYVKNLGGLSGYLFEFTKALKQCKNLKDFRFEEEHVPQTKWLFEALVDCPALERVVTIFLKDKTGLCCKSVFNLIEKSSKLIFLFVTTPSMVEKHIKKAIPAIKERCESNRPPLRCYFQKYMDDYRMIAKVPAIHLYEMVYHELSDPFQLPYDQVNFFEIPDSVMKA